MKSAVKMDVDSVDQVENCSLVNVDQSKSAIWSTSTEKSAVVDIDGILHDSPFHRALDICYRVLLETK